jgi:hypothetical protein
MVKHRIKAWLYPNMLSPESGSYIIRPISERTLSIEEICETATLRGGATMSASEMAHAVRLFNKETEYQLCDGFSINAGLYIAGPQIRGVANSPDDQYDKEKHTLLFEFRQGAELRGEIDDVEVEFVGVADTNPTIKNVFDVKSGSINNLLTPDRALKISGNKLKIMGDNEANGVWFINKTTLERTRVDDSEIVTNNPAELVVMIPKLPVGTYELEITSQYSVGILLKDSRTAKFKKPLTVTGE